MIYDRVSRLARYKSLSPHLTRAIDYAAATDLAALPVGRHEVEGDDVYIAVHEYQTKAASQAKFEAHRRYVDLQIVLSGVERMDVADIASLEVSEPYVDSTDNIFFTSPANPQRFNVSAGEFAIFLAHNAHAPTIAVGEPAWVRKVVLKIRAW